jgi:hypothetical protein
VFGAVDSAVLCESTPDGVRSSDISEKPRYDDAESRQVICPWLTY